MPPKASVQAAAPVVTRDNPQLQNLYDHAKNHKYLDKIDKLAPTKDFTFRGIGTDLANKDTHFNKFRLFIGEAPDHQFWVLLKEFENRCGEVVLLKIDKLTLANTFPLTATGLAAMYPFKALLDKDTQSSLKQFKVFVKYMYLEAKKTTRENLFGTGVTAFNAFQAGINEILRVYKVEGMQNIPDMERPSVVGPGFTKAQHRAYRADKRALVLAKPVTAAAATVQPTPEPVEGEDMEDQGAEDDVEQDQNPGKAELVGSMSELSMTETLGSAKRKAGMGEFWEVTAKRRKQLREDEKAQKLREALEILDNRRAVRIQEIETLEKKVPKEAYRKYVLEHVWHQVIEEEDEGEEEGEGEGEEGQGHEVE